MDELEKSRPRPKTVTLVTVDLVKCFLDGNSATLEFDVNKRQTVYKNCHVIAVVMSRALVFSNDILVDDLDAVIVDILLVNKRNVL